MGVEGLRTGYQSETNIKLVALEPEECRAEANGVEIRGGVIRPGRINRIGLTLGIDQVVQLPRLAALFCIPVPALHLSRLQSGQLFARSGSQTYCFLLLKLGLGPMVQVSV